jgi:outer membrane immunogenic protein
MKGAKMGAYKLRRVALTAAMLSPVILSSGTVSKAADALRAPAYPAPPPPPLFYNWTGVYAGVHAGGGWADLGIGDTGSGFIGGGQIGYNYQINQLVFGLEGDIAGSGIKNNLLSIGTPFGAITANFNWNSLTTLTPRFGYAFDNWLVYGKVGGAWADVSASVNAPFGFSMSAGGTASGWIAGVGAEYAFRNNWSAKIEYNHFDFGNDGSTFITGNSVTLNTVKAGVNYRFLGWPF